MFKPLLAAVACAGLLATPAVAQEATDAPPKKERKICKRLEQTATRMGSQRICKTAAQWEAEAEAAGQTLERNRFEGKDNNDPPPMRSSG